MSIFKQTFSDNIKESLSRRQEAMLRRGPKDIQYLNSRNAWVRMSSSVNIYNKGGDPTLAQLKDAGNYDNTLALKYILQGGVLDTEGMVENLKTGVGEGFSNAYSSTAADGTPLRLGIRPMPGITGIEVKSRGAYGSIRTVTVNFQCWDIHQLEDLELLYMRPGYTVLVEWGWCPYLDIDGSIQTRVDFYDIIKSPKPKETIFKELDEKMKKNGNYEAMFGYVKNYSWSARPDGGYDCKTEIISLGEIIESLKVNYTPSAAMEVIKNNGYLAQYITKQPFNASGLASDIISGTARIVAAIGTIGLSEKLSTDDKEKLEESYLKNILAGMFCELYQIGYSSFKGVLSNTSDEGEAIILGCAPPNRTPFNIPIFHKTINIHGKETSTEIGDSDEQLYISLESLCELINGFVTLRDGDNNQTFVELSVREKDVNAANNKTGAGYLKALAHPLQVSMDPTVCLIKNKLWSDDISITVTQDNNTPNPNDPNSTSPVVTFNYNLGGQDPAVVIDTLIALGIATSAISNRTELNKYLTNLIQGPENARYNKEQVLANVKELSKQYKLKLADSSYKIKPPSAIDVARFGLTINQNKIGKTILESNTTTVFGVAVRNPLEFPPISFYGLLQNYNGFNISSEETKAILVPSGIPAGEEGNYTQSASEDPVKAEQERLQKLTEETQAAIKKGTEDAKKALVFLKNIPYPYYLNDDYNTERGIIGNIFINLNFLYNQATSDAMASQDKKEKMDISLYDFIKNILSAISTSIGNQNNFELFIEPNGKTARIIDLNYVDEEEAESVYKKAFQVEVHNLKSTVRSYKFESKIFQEQSAQVAIGAQISGGATGVDSTSLVDFNKKIRDRIIPVKDMPSSDLVGNDNAAKKQALISSLSGLFAYFARLKFGVIFDDADFDADKANEYNNALKDVINFFKSIAKSKTNSKSIIPTTLSIDMDGLGGLIIGNIFKIPTDLLPKGYKGEDNGPGSKIGYLITGLGHTVGSGDWVTKIDSQFIILDDSGNKLLETIDWTKITININPSVQVVVGNNNNAGGTGGGGGEGSGGSGEGGRFNNAARTAGSVAYDYSPVGKYYLKTKGYANGYIPDHELAYIDSPWTKSTKYQLHPKAAAQFNALREAGEKAGFKFNPASTGAVYRKRSSQTSGPGRAKPGCSPHGLAGALDISQLYRAQGGINPKETLLTRYKNIRNNPAAEGHAMWNWINTNGPDYGWYFPERMKESYGFGEAWHIEYWGPIDGPVGTLNNDNTTNSSKKASSNNTTNVNAIFIGGCEPGYCGSTSANTKGYVSLDTQTSVFKQGYGTNKKVKSFHFYDADSTIADFIKQNLGAIIVMYSAGCNKADTIASIPGVNKNNIYIIEPYAPNGNKNVASAVQMGVPAKNVFVGTYPEAGEGVVKGATPSKSSSHANAPKDVGARLP